MFEPANIYVPENWKEFFVESERSKLPIVVQKANKLFVEKSLSLNFIQNSDEEVQEFSYELLDFSSEKV